MPPPDGVVAANGFTFDRLGVRVPTVAVSPRIPKGTVVHGPTGAQAPTPMSQFDVRFRARAPSPPHTLLCNPPSALPPPPPFPPSPGHQHHFHCE